MTLTNTGFEDGDLTGWDHDHNTGGSVYVDVDPFIHVHSGTYACAILLMGGTGNYGSVWQTLPATNISSLQFYHRTADASDTVVDLQLYTGAPWIDVTTSVGAWGLYATSLLSYTDTSTLYVKVRYTKSTGSPAGLTLDDFSYDLIPTPTDVQISGVFDVIGLYHDIEFTGKFDLEGSSHNVDLTGLMSASHSIISTWRCEID
jgi:hypothetical protein